MVLRAAYRKLVPSPVRSGVRFWRNVAKHVVSERRPVQWDFDDESYWSQRLARGDDEISYPEIVNICAGLLPAGTRLLDIGCGTGRFLHELGKATPVRALGIDVSEQEAVLKAEAVLENVRRWFPAARVVCSIPNTGYVASRLRLLFGRFPRQWIVHPGGHIRFWTLRDFCLLARQLGYAVRRVVPLRGSPLLARWMPGLFGEALVFVLEPTPPG
jgi:SAM-dependent methyltransferase